ncbi:replication initiation protein [Limosilactobacillus mucosae]|uniref:replication initiation protein n=1 Tax=Limosilactobacillus mucosae TaxID=97478 RepID=UPI0039921992
MEPIDKDSIVTQHNDLIKAVARMEKIPLKLFEMAVGAYDSQSNSNEVEIDKELVYDFLDIRGGSRSKRLEKALFDLHQHAVFTLTHKEDDGTETTMTISPISSTSYNSAGSKIKLRFDRDLLPYISMLQTNFTQYRLSDIAELGSKYAIVLYKLLTMSYNQHNYYLRHPDKGKTPDQIDAMANPRFTLTELKHITGTENRYPRFNSFDQSVIKPAVKEICDKTDYSISYDKHKTGRRVTGIIFHVKKDGISYVKNTEKPIKQTGIKLDAAELQTVLSSSYTGLLMAAGLTDPIALTGDADYQRGLLERLYPAYDRFVDRFDQATLERHIKYVGEHTAQKPNSLVPYMLKALADYEERLAQTGTSQKSSRAQINEELPGWAAHPENIKTKKPSPEKLAKIDQMLAELNKKNNAK